MGFCEGRQVKTSQVVFSDGLPKLNTQSCILIHDRKLLNHSNAKKWIKSFPKALAVSAGEKLKDLDQFPAYAKRVLKLAEQENIRELTIVAAGGGSVGDFAGFLASVLKRGVRLVHVPTTWLAAIDSSHGGKTALNVARYKNQIGTFYPAEKVLLSKALLSSQSSKQLKSAYGELYKIALIHGGSLMSSVANLTELSTGSIWKILPAAIKAKIKVVDSDPYEKKKLRYVLNLGHTLGHAFELEKEMPHGEAVLLGTQFALNWSFNKKIMSATDYRKTQKAFMIQPKMSTKISARALKRALLQDKKSTENSKIHFVFLKAPGHCVVQKVDVAEVIAEAKRQGWLK